MVLGVHPDQRHLKVLPALVDLMVPTVPHPLEAPLVLECQQSRPIRLDQEFPKHLLLPDLLGPRLVRRGQEVRLGRVVQVHQQFQTDQLVRQVQQGR